MNTLKKLFNKVKTKTGFVFLILILLGLLIPLRPVHAFVDVLAGLISSYLFAFIVQFVLAIANLILGLAIFFLNWVLSEGFIDFSYTGMDNPVVRVGWPLLRDLANMFFVIILIVIGLSTALRIEEYHAQKTLPILIIIALLVNFTPVITGLIIDATNIVMNFFLSGVSGGDVVRRQFEAQGSMIMEALKGWYNPLAVMGTVFKGIVLVIFDLLAAVIFLLFAVLFMMRYVVLWMLVVLSPIAFASYIIPLTRGFWTSWWHQFNQWCIVGITCAFFLYLGSHLLVQLPKLPPEPEATNPVAGLMRSILPYGISLAFLAIGFFTGISGAATGSGAITSFAQKGVKTLTSKAGLAARARAGSWAKEQIPEGVRKAAERMATLTPPTPTWGTGVGGLRGGVQRAAAGAVGTVSGAVAAPAKGIGQALGPGLIESERKEIDAAEKQVAGQTVASQSAAYARARSDRERIGILNAMIKDKNIDDAMKTNVFGTTDIARKATITRLYQVAQNRHDKHSVLRSAFSDIAAANLPPGTVLSGGMTSLDYVFDRIKPADYDKVSRTTLNNNDFVDTVVQRGGGSHVKGLIDGHEQGAVQRLEERLKELAAASSGTTPSLVTRAQINTYLLNRNRKLHRYLTAGGGRGLLGII